MKKSLQVYALVLLSADVKTNWSCTDIDQWLSPASCLIEHQSVLLSGFEWPRPIYRQFGSGMNLQMVKDIEDGEDM